MKNFLEKNKRALLNIALMFVALAVVSVLFMLVLMAFDVIYFDDGMKFHHEMFYNLKTSWYGRIVFILLQTLLSMMLCVIPGASMAFVLLSKALYTYAWESFIISFASVMTASTIMYLLGRFGGYRVCAKFLGAEDCKKAMNLLRNKGTVYFPIMMMFPIFPDDALVMMAGTIRMSLKWFIPSIVIGRGIGIATIIFGLSLVPFDKFTSIWHWILFVLVCAVFIFLVLFCAFKFNRHMENKRKNCNDDKS